MLAGLKALNGQLEFFNVDEMETMATAEHFMATDVEWDPTGEPWERMGETARDLVGRGRANSHSS